MDHPRRQDLADIVLSDDWGRVRFLAGRYVHAVGKFCCQGVRTWCGIPDTDLGWEYVEDPVDCPRCLGKRGYCPRCHQKFERCKCPD
jgi:hypothetical protein